MRPETEAGVMEPQPLKAAAPGAGEDEAPPAASRGSRAGDSDLTSVTGQSESLWLHRGHSVCGDS